MNPMNRGKPPKLSVHDISMTVRFTIFYLLLVFIPTIIFIWWFSAALMRERQMEYAFEQQSVLRQSVMFFDGYIGQADYVYATLQSNKALTDILSNYCPTPADELYAYNTSVSPAFTGLLSSNTVVGAIGIYRYLDSSVRYADMAGFIGDASQFPYDSAIIDRLFSEGRSSHIESPPPASSLSTNKTSSLRLVNLYTIYNSDYSTSLGILEVHIDLNRVFAGMSPGADNMELYLKHNDSYYPFVDGTEHVPMELSAIYSPGDTLIAEQTSYNDFGIVLRGHNNFAVDIAAVFNTLRALFLLLIPASLFWVFIYRYASRLLRFSHHIRGAKDAGLVSFDEFVGNDEFGIVVSEYNKMTKMINDLINSVREAEKLKSEASYYAMSSQVNPHFMFNTLENIRMHIEIEEYAAASDMLFILSNFLRYNITLKRESTIFEELNHIRRYLQIYQYRQNDRISFDIAIDEDVQDTGCPFCILQPIVENCLKHGIKEISSNIEITVNVKVVSGGLEICVSDNGSGMTDEELERINKRIGGNIYENGPAQGANSPTSGAGVGIGNVDGRIKYYYGGEYGLSYKKSPSGGVSCVINIGYNKKQEGGNGVSANNFL